MKYTDASGTERTLTPHQHRYLTALARKGHLPLDTGNQRVYDSRITMRLLEERGLATGQDWHCPLSPHCLTGITDLGRKVLRPGTVTTPIQETDR